MSAGSCDMAADALVLLMQADTVPAPQKRVLHASPVQVLPLPGGFAYSSAPVCRERG